MACVVTGSATGRVDLPEQVRRQVGLGTGGTVSVWVEDGEIRMGALRHVMAELQAEAKAVFDGTGESVDSFLASRRAERAEDPLR